MTWCCRTDVSDAELFETDTLWGFFERLREEDPVHYCAESEFGPYWSVTRFDDIVHVEKNHEIFSSARSIVLSDPEPDFQLEAGPLGVRSEARSPPQTPASAPMRDVTERFLPELPGAESRLFVLSSDQSPAEDPSPNHES